MSRKEWLKERLERTDGREESERRLKRMGLTPESEKELLARGPSPEWIAKWHAFVAQMGPHDELWYFESPYRPLASVGGYAIVRSGQIVASLVSWRS